MWNRDFFAFSKQIFVTKKQLNKLLLDFFLNLLKILFCLHSPLQGEIEPAREQAQDRA